MDKTTKIRLNLYNPALYSLQRTCKHQVHSRTLYFLLCVLVFAVYKLPFRQKYWFSICMFKGKPVILRSILRDNETFSTHLEENLSVPPRVVQSLMNAEVKLSSVSIIPLLCFHVDPLRIFFFNLWLCMMEFKPKYSKDQDCQECYA